MHALLINQTQHSISFGVTTRVTGALGCRLALCHDQRTAVMHQDVANSNPKSLPQALLEKDSLTCDTGNIIFSLPGPTKDSAIL
jgi:hypothetical protein